MSCKCMPIEHVCPECIEGKHRNCDGIAWCFRLDGGTRCLCRECS